MRHICRLVATDEGAEIIDTDGKVLAVCIDVETARGIVFGWFGQRENEALKAEITSLKADLSELLKAFEGLE